MKQSFSAFLCSALIMIGLWACRGKSGGNPPTIGSPNITGAWEGTYTTNIQLVASTATISITQTSGDLSGTFETTRGHGGTLSGSINSSDITMVLTSTISCLGTFNITATVSNSDITASSWTGNDCDGTHTSGTGALSETTAGSLGFTSLLRWK